LDKALQFTEEALRSQYVSRPSWIIECLYLKCLCQIAELSDYKQQECIEKIQDLQDQFPSEAFKDLRSFMQTEFFLRNGDIQKAWDSWIVLEGTNTSYKYHYYQPRLTEIKLLMANHPYRDLDRAEALLNDYESLARETHDPNLHMQTLVLKIVLMVLQNDSDKALKQLRSMLAETRKESIIRLFTDLGEPIYTLLGSLTGKEKSDPYIRKILHSFERSPSRVVSKAAGRNKDQDLVKIALSEKETQILELISEGYQNKEIADKLCHSLGTIKTYVYNLYQKIGVKNRAQAIAHYSTTFRKSSQAAPLDS
jgi:ATP/maltotriose-dependent transcriptional regulator MalT